MATKDITQLPAIDSVVAADLLLVRDISTGDDSKATAQQIKDFVGPGFVNPMDGVGQMIKGTTGGAAAKQALGSALQFLRVNSGGTDIEWSSFITVSSWTPTVAGGTTPGTPTYTSQVGSMITVGTFFKILQFYLAWSAVSGGSGDLVISGFGFTLPNTGLFPAGSIGFTDLTSAAGLWGNSNTQQLKVAINSNSPPYTYKSIVAAGSIGGTIIIPT